MTQKHTHDWEQIAPDTTALGWACTECPATASPCGTCERRMETSGRTCDRCISNARNDLREIRDLYRALPDVIAATAGLHAIRYDRGTGGSGKQTSKPRDDTTIIGGAAFVMANRGNADKTRLGRSEDMANPDVARVIRELAAAEQWDPPSVFGVLTFWEDAWRQEQRHHAADKTSVDAAVDYLRLHTTWAAQHSEAWDDYLADLHTLRRRLRALTGQSDAPEEAGVPCMYCSGTIIQKWRDAVPGVPGSGGLDDAHECSGCGIRWTSEAHFRLAIREAHTSLPQTHPDQLVTLDDAKRIYKGRVRPNLFALWLWRDRRDAEKHQAWLDEGNVGPTRRPRLPAAHGLDVRGVELYRLADLDDRVGGSDRDATEATA